MGNVERWIWCPGCPHGYWASPEGVQTCQRCLTQVEPNPLEPGRFRRIGTLRMEHPRWIGVIIL